MPAIEIQGLTKRFGKVEAVRDLSFAVQEGKVTGFLGPNGAGKTTTLRVLLGLARPTSGTATFGGQALRAARLAERVTSARCSRTSRSTRAAAGATTCACSPPRAAIPSRASTSCSSASA